MPPFLLVFTCPLPATFIGTPQYAPALAPFLTAARRRLRIGLAGAGQALSIATRALLAVAEGVVHSAAANTAITATLENLTLAPLLTAVGNPLVNDPVNVIDGATTARGDKHLTATVWACAHSAIVA